MAPKGRTPKDSLTRQLLGAIDQMQDLAPGTTVHVSTPPESARQHTPWKLVAEFTMPGGMHYDDVAEYLINWRDDSKIRRSVGKNRMSRIIVRYKNKNGRGSRGEYTLAKIGGWDIAISVAVERLVVRDGNRPGLIERYGTSAKKPSYIESIIVWFSTATSQEVRFGRDKKKTPPKKVKESKTTESGRSLRYRVLGLESLPRRSYRNVKS